MTFSRALPFFARTAMGQLAYPKPAAMGRLHFIQSVVVYHTGEPLQQIPNGILLLGHTLDWG